MNTKPLTFDPTEKEKLDMFWECRNKEIAIEAARREREEAGEVARIATERKNNEKRLVVSYWKGLSWQAFEHELALVFDKKGWKTELTQTSGDGGVDIKIKNVGMEAMIQCKAHSKPVGVRDIRDLFGTFMHEKESNANLDRAILASTSGFTGGVEKFAENKPIDLLGLPEIIKIQESIKHNQLNDILKLAPLISSVGGTN